MKKEKVIHILVIIFGIIFILLPAFHSTIWFDESYSVAIAKHGFADIWKITGNDVHPALYYWGLHLVYLLFGNSILAFRLFSVLAIIILGILGYTHIRKDFGEKTGILFSFLTYFLPIMCTYASEIRMYSWSCLIVTLMAIYGYRFYKNAKSGEKIQKKNLILFGIFSICSCYLHYYALVTASLINLILLIFLIKNIVLKDKGDNKLLKQYEFSNKKKALIAFILVAVIQVILYVPWLIYLLGQLEHVGGGFWIKVGLVNTTVEVLSFQFRRQLDTDFTVDFHTILSFVAALLMYIYIGIRIYKAKKENKEIKPAILAIGVYIGVILLILLVSIKMPILYSRYLLVMTGLYIFGIAFMMSTEEKKNITYMVCAIILAFGIWSNVEDIKINYDLSNLAEIQYIKDEIQQDDIIVYSNIGNGGVIAANFPNNKQYFLNFEQWDVKEAYKAYGPGMETVISYDFLENYTGRIWLIDSEYMGLYENFPKEHIKVLKGAKRFDTKYHNYIYNIMLLEKN